ncbi:hypothetical protein GCM10010989_12220 [Croceicoccus pelagius]|uniref:Uncharacterized protein n=1 Tax=Croceicoccus pelagius TaxID=1703341 RepID=A0A917DIC3_9SPHN|nr:hypothetical protein GCM10010989_12220 [Croceicoccus pelagius]
MDNARLSGLQRGEHGFGQILFENRRIVRGKLLAQRVVARDFGGKRGIACDLYCDLLFAFAFDLAVGESSEFLFRRGHAVFSSSIAISASRPRTSRELSVPTGQPTISAASL